MSIKSVLACGLAGLCLLMAGCGGGGSDASAVTELPNTVSITNETSIEVDIATAFTTNLSGATNGLKFAWTFGDGTGSTDAAPTHTYVKGGDYLVTLSVTNEVGTTRSSGINVTASRLAMVTASACTGAAHSGWCWQRPKPTGSAMVDEFFIDASTGWAVGEAGQILSTSDGGATWTGQRSGVSNRLTQVRFVSRTTGWVAGDGGTVLKTVDGGITWTPQALGLGNVYYSSASLVLVALDSTRAVISVPNSTARTTTDGGEHWQTSVLNPTVTTPNGTLWGTGYNNTVMKSVDLGASSTIALQVSTLEFIYSLDFADDAHVWALGVDYSNSTAVQVMWRTNDAGVTWQKLPVTSASINGYYKFTSASVGWAMTGYAIYRTTDAGTTWTPVMLPSSLPTYFYSASPLAFDDSTFWLPYDNGGYLTRDGGVSWAFLQVASETNYIPARLQLLAGGAQLMHYGARSYRSVDNGSTWQQVLGQDVMDQNGNLLAAWFFDGKHGLGFSSGGWMVETRDSGLTWIRRALTGVSSFGPSRLQFASATTGWLLTGSGTAISRSTDAGATWSVPLTSVNFNGTTDFHFADEQSGWFVTYTGAINHSADGGLTWTTQTTLPYTLNGVRFASPTAGIVVGAGGTIARTTDGGASWSLRPSAVAQDLKRVTFADADNAWAIGSYGTVTRSTDAGRTWTKVAVPSTANLNDVTFVDALHGWIVGDGGILLATTDGGRSWQSQASGTTKSLSCAFFVDTRTGWVVGEGGSILATATGGN